MEQVLLSLLHLLDVPRLMNEQIVEILLAKVSVYGLPPVAPGLLEVLQQKAPSLLASHLLRYERQ